LIVYYYNMSKNIDHNLFSTLASLGLNEKEAKVYITLLQKGEMGAIKISQIIGLHRQFVYNALSVLREKGLVVQLGTTRTIWKAQNPRRFIALAEEHERQAKQVVEELLALKEEKAGQEFEVAEGEKAFRSRIIATIRSVPHGSTVRMICGEWGRYFKHAGVEVHAEWDRIRIAKEIKFRILGPASLKGSMTDAVAKRALLEFRTLSGLEENLVNTVIYDDRVDFDIYGDPHVAFSIKNPEVAESQRRFFETLWQNQSNHIQ